jgi:hypothetical protein
MAKVHFDSGVKDADRKVDGGEKTVAAVAA